MLNQTKAVINILLAVRGLLDGVLILLQQDEPPAMGQDSPVRTVQDASGRADAAVKTFGGKVFQSTDAGGAK